MADKEANNKTANNKMHVIQRIYDIVYTIKINTIKITHNNH